jgi:lysylphosphatidylglycerol synthetase-like protein (DUF2156 family)
MIDNQELQQILLELAKQLDTTIPHLWAVMVRQAYIRSVAEIIFAPLTIAISFYALVKYSNSNIEDEDNSSPLFILSLVGWIITTILTIVFVTSFGYLITGILNPEYRALQDILEIVK